MPCPHLPTRSRLWVRWWKILQVSTFYQIQTCHMRSSLMTKFWNMGRWVMKNWLFTFPSFSFFLPLIFPELTTPAQLPGCWQVVGICTQLWPAMDPSPLQFQVYGPFPLCSSPGLWTLSPLQFQVYGPFPLCSSRSMDPLSPLQFQVYGPFPLCSSRSMDPFPSVVPGLWTLSPLYFQVPPHLLCLKCPLSYCR